MGLGFCRHRYSAPHHIDKERTKWLRTCRNCDEQIISWFDVENGKIMEKRIHGSNQGPKDP